MKRALFVVWAGCILALTGCVTTIGSETYSKEELTPERQAEIVKKRFQERWDALMAKDYEKVYSFLSPATRETISKEQYKEVLSRGQFKKVEFEKAECENDSCMVRFLLTYDFGRAKDVTTPTGEKWFFQDGQAWFNLPRN